MGFGYVTPVATVAKWFPDKKGLATGLVVMGFGLGALIMSKIFAPILMEYFGGNLVQVFATLGVIFLVLTMPFGWCLKNPPAGYVPAGYEQQLQDKEQEQKKNFNMDNYVEFRQTLAQVNELTTNPVKDSKMQI
ncbi:MAG: MFS transporter [Deltaproteobacteria bacterium]|nr:MFS transporter [Deltaproteobacteria bacterium]